MQRVPDIPSLPLQSQRIELKSSPTWLPVTPSCGAVPVSCQLCDSAMYLVGNLIFLVLSDSPFRNTEMRHQKSNGLIWRLLSFKTVLRMCILADPKRTFVPRGRFHIMWSIIHCPAAAVSCFLLPCYPWMSKLLLQRGIHPWPGMKNPLLLNGKLHRSQAGSVAQDPELMMLPGLFCRQKNPPSIFIGIFSN